MASAGAAAVAAKAQRWSLITERDEAEEKRIAAAKANAVEFEDKKREVATRIGMNWVQISDESEALTPIPPGTGYPSFKSRRYGGGGGGGAGQQSFDMQYDPYASMPNDFTATQHANSIIQSITQQPAGNVRYIDAAVKLSSTSAAVIVHKLVRPVDPAAKALLESKNILISTGASPVAPIRAAIAAARDNVKLNIADVPSVKKAWELNTRLALALRKFDEEKLARAMDSAMDHVARSEFAGVELQNKYADVLQLLKELAAEGRGNASWPALFARGMAFAFLYDYTAPRKPETSQKEREADDFIIRVHNNKYDSRTAESVAGTPLLPGPRMTQRGLGLTVVHCALHHDARKPLELAMLELLCIRLVATLHGQAMVFFNDFAARRFRGIGIKGAEKSGYVTQDGDNAPIKISAPTYTMNTRMFTDSQKQELFMLATAFRLPQLAAACSRDANRVMPIERWSVIRRSVLTSDISNDAVASKWCAMWIHSFSTLDEATALAAIKRLSWQEDVATHPNGMQFVRVSSGGAGMQRGLTMPTTKETFVKSARMMTPQMNWTAIGDTKTLVANADSVLTPVGPVMTSIAKRLYSLEKHVQQAYRVASQRAKVLVDHKDTTWAKNMVASQPAYSNCVAAWAVLNQLTDRNGNKNDRRVLVVNDWLGSWKCAIEGSSGVHNVYVPKVMTGSEADFKKLLSPGASVEKSLSDISVDAHFSDVKDTPVIVVNMNWGSPVVDKAGNKTWPELLKHCADMGEFIGALIDEESDRDVIVCTLLPGRKTNPTHTNKSYIGKQSVPDPVYDTGGGERRQTFYFDTRGKSEPTTTILTTATRALVTTESKNVFDHVFVTHVEIGPLALVIIKITTKKPTINVEAAQFKSALQRAWDATGRQYTQWLPKRQWMDIQKKKQKRRIPPLRARPLPQPPKRRAPANRKKPGKYDGMAPKRDLFD